MDTIYVIILENANQSASQNQFPTDLVHQDDTCWQLGKRGFRNESELRDLLLLLFIQEWFLSCQTPTYATLIVEGCRVKNEGCRIKSEE